jgi:hypothetical protein
LAHAGEGETRFGACLLAGELFTQSARRLMLVVGRLSAQHGLRSCKVGGVMEKDKTGEPLLLEPYIEVLLKEYELCTGDANHLEEVIWTTAGVLFTASVAGLGILGGTIPVSPRPYDYLLRIGIALLSIVFVWSWRIISTRWYSIQRAMYYRIIEIEEELGMYKERYVSYLDKAIENKLYLKNQRVDTMITALKAKHRPGGVRRTVTNIAWVLTASWCVFVVSQVAALLGVI